MNNTIFKKIYKVRCELITALHIGCASQSPVGAMEIMKNGNGEIMIPGTSIAGLFFDTLSNLETNIRDHRLIKKNASYIIFRSVIFENIKYLKIRDRVKMNRELKVADEGSLFSYWEIEPEMTNFDICIEIDNLSLKNLGKDFEIVDKWIQKVLKAWADEGFFLGAHNSSGNGRVKLLEISKAEVTENNFDDYLDDKLNFSKYLDDKDKNVEKLKPLYKKYKITVDINDEEDAYGTNALLIKGGVSHDSLVKNPSDAVFINTGKRLFIPGSSLKGSISMFLEKYGKNQCLKDMFGQEESENQGYIYFPDMFFNNVNKANLVNIERHAEDEFTRAVLGSSKFNEERLFYSKSEDYILIPMKFYNQKSKEIQDMFDFIKKGFEKKLISLGANSCYPNICIEEVN